MNNQILYLKNDAAAAALVVAATVQPTIKLAAQKLQRTGPE
jgi:hypothetical protein